MSGSQNTNRNKDASIMVTVATASLKERLNHIYHAMRRQPRHPNSSGLFEYLWNLKELALLEGKTSVLVPTNWLAELEHDLATQECQDSTHH